MTIEEKRKVVEAACEVMTKKHPTNCGSYCNMVCNAVTEDEIETSYRLIPSELCAESNQTAKADAGKPKLTLVPQQILYDIAEVRMYGCQKYKDPDNWKNVEKERYRDAAFRHFLAYLREPNGVDEESGLPHLSHLACNVAFLCELEKENQK